MSIGKRLIDMARSELNSLLDVAAKHGPDDDEPAERVETDAAAATPRGGSRWQDEVEWARRARQEVEDAIHGRRTPEPPPRTRAGGAASRPRGATGETLRVQKAYAALEVPVGADFETVRRSYRTLMRKYHPDHHTQSPEKQKAANDVAQGLTDAYKVLEKKLRK